MRTRFHLVGAALLFLMITGGWLYLAGRGAGVNAERPRTAAAEHAAAVAEAAVSGERQSSARTDAARARRAAAADAIARTFPQIITAEDADAPLDVDRAARLRRLDDELCRIAPELEGCAAAGHAG